MNDELCEVCGLHSKNTDCEHRPTNPDPKPLLETPRTDAVINDVTLSTFGEVYEGVKQLARTLEKELNEANKKNTLMEVQVQVMLEQNNELYERIAVLKNVAYPGDL